MKAWEGRFKKKTDEMVEKFTSSLPFDSRLYPEDIRGSIAHVNMLAKRSIIPLEEADTITAGLQKIFGELETGKFVFDPADEDIHMAVERRLGEIAGPVGGKLHTARSRNDQVTTDLRLYVKKEIGLVCRLIREVQAALVALARRHSELIMPGFTHLQPAQPVLFSHYLLAHFQMLSRDFKRFKCAFKRTDQLPLGAAALAGTSFPIDREFVAGELGFAGVCENSIDAVSDRDYVVEFLAASSLTMVHLGRLSEEFILMAGPAFGFIEIDEAFATGSSIMPQKKNPDVCELIRGRFGRVQGHLTGFLASLKGLPFGYNRDLQEDKEALFDTADTVKSCLEIVSPLLETVRINKQAMEKAAAAGFALATDIADYLTKKGLPFRDAHRVTGEIVRYCLERNKDLTDLTAQELAKFSPGFGAGGLDWLTLRASVESRESEGGTGPESVSRQIEQAEEQLADEAAWIERNGSGG